MDVKLYNTADGGAIDYVNGLAVMSTDGGIASAVYLSLFGGNELDSGEEGTDSLQWWGNLGEADEARQFRSRTQFVLRAMPAVSSNLRRLEDAMLDDLAWLLEGIATSIDATASLVAPRRVSLAISVTVGVVEYPIEFEETWGQ